MSCQVSTQSNSFVCPTDNTSSTRSCAHHFESCLDLARTMLKTSQGFHGGMILVEATLVKEDDDDFQGTTNPQQKGQNESSLGNINKSKGNRIVSCIGILIRLFLLDLPLILLLTAYFGFRGLHYVHDRYIAIEMEALEYPTKRVDRERTYYQRHCIREDITTLNYQDLLLSETATVDEAYQHQHKHGFSIFPNVMSQQTASNFREYVVAKSKTLTKKESLDVLSEKKRYSFSLDTSVPIVGQAVQEVTNNQRLTQAIEKFLGPDPTFVEMSVITSNYGAKNQDW